MRVEDLDAPRVRPGMEGRILDELRWLGLDWDEGPDLGGRGRPLPAVAARGALRARRWARSGPPARLPLLLLARRDRRGGRRRPTARPTTGRATRAPAGRSRRPRWPAAAGERRPAWRLPGRAGRGGLRRTASTAACAYDVAATTGDFVVMRADGIAAYQLAVVVDDAAMGITDVVRGDDLLPSTARQLLVYRALGLAAPRFAHVPLVVGEDGERLAKRHGALSLGELRERGADPRAVVGLLATLSGLAAPGARCWPRDLVAGFDLSRLPRAPARLAAAQVAALLGG